MQNKELARYKRHRRIRMKVSGSPERPRLLVRRSIKNLTVTGIDDVNHKVLFTISTIHKDVKEKCANGGNVKAAECLGEVCARKMVDKGYTKIVFDRGGNLYHGRIKALADALRKGNIEF